MFRILGSVNALNEKMSLGLTHHDVNWVYNLHHLKGQGYYLKSRYPKVRLIQCLPGSNKGPLSSFQAPKCAIKAKDPRLHWISVATPGFLIISPIPKGVLTTEPIPEGIPKVALPFQRATEEEAIPSQPSNMEEEEVVEIFESEDDFKVFCCLQSFVVPIEDFSYSPSAQVSQI